MTEDEKNMRWGLNKFYYTQHKNSLSTAYTMTMRAKYCDKNGVLLPKYPSIHQFRYFEKKHRRLQNYYISRDGIKDYQKNHRPLLGDGVQEFASHVGVGMLDATVCDIYLVNESGGVVGRPILTACIDAYSGLCCGYALSWEGGTYSLRGLMLNVITDKQEYCRQCGISIRKEEWTCDKLPGTLVTDMGSEYISETFGQIAELGVTLINLPAYRPELKGPVEKFFDLIQGYFKPHLKGKGVIEPDFRQRGGHDYRRDACLTMRQFEQIIDKIIEMRLISMSDAFRIQIEDPRIKEIPFEDRFEMLVDIEYSNRKNNSLKRLIPNAGFDQPDAYIGDINYTSGRKLNRSLIERLATCEYITEHRNLFITGATGSGKTYLACAFGMEACKQRYKTKYVRLPDLLLELEMARNDGTYKKVQGKYANPVLLIIDEWLLLKPTESEQHDILELLHRRRRKSSTIFCSQYDSNGWYDQLGGDDSPLSEAILDRIKHDAYKINIVPTDPANYRSMREVYGLDPALSE